MTPAQGTSDEYTVTSKGPDEQDVDGHLLHTPGSTNKQAVPEPPVPEPRSHNSRPDTSHLHNSDDPYPDKQVPHEQFPVSMIHPQAPEFFSAVALYNAPINVEEAAARIRELWNEDVQLHWDDVEGGKILRFTLENVLVLLTPVSKPMQPDKGVLPSHRFHVAITCFAPVDTSRIPDATSEETSTTTTSRNDIGLARRSRALAAHVVMTELMDALMREEASVGIFRPDLGVVQPPHMVIELADVLSKGQAPLPLWIGIRTQKQALTFGRTLGLHLFGHLDVEVLDSAHSEADVYAMLANIADYVVTSHTYILPGQSVGYREGKELTVTQDVSPADGAQVLRIAF